jgi:catechol 2,3-dioxygenase-like lactoylglutathione lyase family enzyme
VVLGLKRLVNLQLERIKMFSHIMLGANDLEASRKFYDAVLGTLGIKPGTIQEARRYFYRSPTGVFAITKPIDGKAATAANGGTIGFAAKSVEEVDQFHAAGLAHGGAVCEGGPGFHDGPSGVLYIAWLRDPSGNKICVLHRVPSQSAA